MSQSQSIPPLLRNRTAAVFGLVAIALLTAGCGSSSTSGSTRASTGTSPSNAAQPTISTSTSGASAASTQSTTTTTASTSTAAAGVVTGASGMITATLHAGTHHPKVNQAWPLSFTVSVSGHPANASVSYEYLFGGQVVAHRSHYTFTGHFSDVFRWPSTAVGYPLTFRAVIVSGAKTINLDYPVQVSA